MQYSWGNNYCFAAVVDSTTVSASALDSAVVSSVLSSVLSVSLCEPVDSAAASAS